MNMYKIPDPGETIIDDGGVAYIPGGKGANAAITMKKDLKGRALFVFVITCRSYHCAVVAAERERWYKDLYTVLLCNGGKLFS